MVVGMSSDYAAAVEYARQYRGSFEFMVEMRKAVEADRPFSPGMIAAVLRCKARDDARAVEVLQSSEDPFDLNQMPEGTTHAAVEYEGTLLFLRIDRVMDGGWTGWSFVKEQHGDTYVRLGKQRPGGLYIGEKKDALRAVLADPLAATIRYGKELGVCGVCHATLTNEESRAAGIGPVCRKRFA